MQCDACSIPRDEVAPLLFFALKAGGAAFKLYNSGHAPDSKRGGAKAKIRVESWRRVAGPGFCPSRDAFGALGSVETEAKSSTASMWSRLWVDGRPDAVERARRHGLPLYRVVHAPRVAVRDKPTIKGGAIVGSFRKGDLVVARRGHDALFPWLCISCLTEKELTRAAEARILGKDPPPKSYVLTDGAEVSLGALLERIFL